MQPWSHLTLRLLISLSVWTTAKASVSVQSLRARGVLASTDVLVNGTDGDPGVYPISEKDSGTGWRFMPDITSLAGATLDTTSMVVGTKGATLTNYITSDYTASKIKRAVVIIHGEDRVSWNMQIYTTLALKRAVTGGTVQEDEVVIMAP
jgi:hypothetical protein